ncbi:MAG: hypothetical protein P8Z81_01230 [Deinococcales bacterium]
MQATRIDTLPMALSEVPPEVPATDRELATLLELARAGLPVAPVVVVPAAVEERFYRFNNLPDRLIAAFADVDPEDPDEDDVEEAVPVAQALIRQHYLLDEVIDAFYAATRNLPPELRIRRPEHDGETAARGRPALLALKHAYQRDWSFEAVWARLQARDAIALEARPVLVHGAEDRAAPQPLLARVASLLERRVAVRVTGDGRICGVRPA